MRKPCSLECETVEVTGKSLRMFPIGKQEGWLIGMVTGQLANKRALKRCGIFISLKDRLQSSVEGASAQQPAIDDKMATMRFDDEEEVSPVKKRTPSAVANSMRRIPPMAGEPDTLRRHHTCK